MKDREGFLLVCCRCGNRIWIKSYYSLVGMNKGMLFIKEAKRTHKRFHISFINNPQIKCKRCGNVIYNDIH